MSSHSASSCIGSDRSLQQLPPALQLHILSFLPLNDRALSGRLVSPDAAASLSGPQYCTASLSQPLPPHAVPWAVEAGQQHVRQLPFQYKLQLLCTAAASGSEANLEVALALYQPSIFPELLHQMHHKWAYPAFPNPGVVAVRAGHLQLLGWLLRHCPTLLVEVGYKREILRAAAQRCDLAGLQAVWAALGCGNSTASPPLMDQGFLDWVAASPVDAEAKVEWVLAEGRGSCSLKESTAAAAARWGDLGRLRWLRERGCLMRGQGVLLSALQHADLAVAEWLVDEAGCGLPAAAGEEGQWTIILDAAAKSPDGVAKLQWLRGRGAPSLGGNSGVLKGLVRSAAEAAQAEVVRHLLSGLEPAAAREAAQDAVRPAVGSGSIPTAEALVQAGAEVGHHAYTWSVGHGGLDKDYVLDCASDYNGVAMVRWLAREARASAARLLSFIFLWPSDTPAHSRDLLQAVQLLMGEAGCAGWEARDVVILAAHRGDLALVQYLLQQRPGFRPGWEVLVAAAQGGCEALLEWLVMEHPSCLTPPEGRSPYARAAASGDLGTLTALRRLGVLWGSWDVAVQAVRRGCSAPALRWLKEQGAPLGSREAMEAALDSVGASDAGAEVAAWLHSLAVAEAEAG